MMHQFGADYLDEGIENINLGDMNND